MHKFYNIKKVTIILMCLTFIKYCAWCVFFICQGQAIQQAIDKNTLSTQLLSSLIAFFFAKCLVMGIDLVSQFTIAYCENQAIAEQWKHYFPQKIYQDNDDKNNLIYLAYFDYLPNLYYLQCNTINNNSTIISVFLIIISLLIYTKFYVAIFALMIIFLLNFFSKNMYLTTINRYHKDINEHKATVLGWINQYFKAYREVSFNWQGQLKPWLNNAYDALYLAKKKLVMVQLIRDILAQLMVELPFTFNTTLMMVAVYLDYISITQLFVWVGFSQFAINASNAFLENNVNNAKKKALINKLDDIVMCFQDKLLPNSSDNHGVIMSNIAIKLQDNTVNTLSLEPAIHHIQGKNGSGKTTLLNLIIGYEREIEIDNHHHLKQLLAPIAAQNIRVIERDPVIFDSLTSFDQQLLGPKDANSMPWQIVLMARMNTLLTKEVLQDVLIHGEQLEDKFYNREQGRLSSGEKIFISLLRVLTSWDKDVAIVVIDECSAFLDRQIKGLFLRCLTDLSIHACVYISTHEDVG